MSVETNQRNATRNQSTADFQRKNIFTFGNRNQEGVFENNTLTELTAEAGILVKRNTGSLTNKDRFVPIEGGGDESAIVGILNVESQIVLAASGTTNCNVCISGDIDAGLLIFPSGVTLNTVVGDKLLKDILTNLGFVLNNVTENSNFDN